CVGEGAPTASSGWDWGGSAALLFVGASGAGAVDQDDEPGGTGQHRGNDAEQRAGAGVADAGGNFGADPGRHTAAGRYQYPGTAANAARGICRHCELEPVGGWGARIYQQLFEVAAGADRRTQRVYAAVRRGVLAGAGPRARGYRPYRGHPWTGWDGLGRE